MPGGARELVPRGFSDQTSAFRDWCGDETTFPREVAESALAHTITNATEAAYRRATALEAPRAHGRLGIVPRVAR